MDLLNRQCHQGRTGVQQQQLSKRLRRCSCQPVWRWQNLSETRRVDARLRHCVQSAFNRPIAIGSPGKPCLVLTSPCHASWVDQSTALIACSALSGSSVATQDVIARSSSRVTRLETLVELRRLYRNCLRAQALLAYPSPVYSPSEQADPEASTSLDALDEAEEEKQLAIRIVAEMQLTSEQIKASLRVLPNGLDNIFPNSAAESETRIRDKAAGMASQLKTRAASEIGLLPFASEAEAQLALNQRNSRFRRSSNLQTGEQEVDADGRTISQRLGQAEKVAENFVARQLKPVLKKAQESDIMEVVKESSLYLKGLWTRLNGGKSGSPEALLLSLDLPIPGSLRKEIAVSISQLSLALDNLEKRLQDESKSRESKLRNAGMAGRVQMAMQLKLMDSEILALSRQLAVRTLQLEMEYIYRSLEEEALEIVRDMADWRSAAVVQREGSTEELAVLVAEFNLLDEQLSILSAMVQDGTLLLAGDDILEKLAVEIPDMRSRVGVQDQLVYGGSGFSLTKARLQVKEGVDKIGEGANFMLRGLRLLQSDISNVFRLFTKAATGGSLKAREVTSLRRTARDILTFIPFTIILIIPLTPLGHVLVFGFIQRYFPSFYPSQFTTKRQQIMMRYEELKQQLTEAQARAEQEEEEAELRRATDAVMRLTAPVPRAALPSPDDQRAGEPAQAGGSALGGAGQNGGGAAARSVELLQQKVMEVEQEVHSGDELEGAAVVEPARKKR